MAREADMRKCFEIRIELLDVDPLIWRTVLVPDDIPLMNLGAVLLGAMGWKAAHLFAFEIEGQRYDITFDDGLDLDDTVDMDGVIAREVLKPGAEAAFQYDFGDDWWHELKIADHRDIPEGDKLPRCIDGAGACPPEDCGGPFGYAEMLDAAADEDHPDHEEMRDLLEEIKPKAFEKKTADRNMKRVLKIYAP